MIVRIYLEGKIRDKAVSAFVSEYAKRLSPFFEFETVELGSGDSALLKRLRKSSSQADVFIALDADGRKYDSESFARRFDELRNRSRSVNFIIGEAEGLSETALALAGERLSLSDMTFSYRVCLMAAAEQIYRAMTIITGHPYHK